MDTDTIAPVAKSPQQGITPYLQRVLNAVSDPVIIQSPDLKISFANTAADRLIPGANAEESHRNCFCHEVLFDFDRPCSDYGFPCPLEMVLTEKKEICVVRKHVTAEGLSRWLEIKGQPILDDSGEVIQVVETIHDITSHKEIAKALRRYNRSQEEFFHASRKISSTSELKELYRHIVSHAKELLQFDFSTLMLFTEDKSGLIFHDSLGFPESTINTRMGMDGKGLAPYVAQTRTPDAVVDFKTESRFAVPQLVAERNIRSALCVPMIIADEILGVLVGHTLRQRIFTDQEVLLYDNLANQAAMALYSAKTHRELRASEDRYHDLFENSLDIIQMVGADGRILFANKAWKKTLGYSDEEISQLSAFDIIHPDSRSHCQEMFGQLCRGEKVDLIETTFVAKDGRSFPVEGHINANMKDGALVSTRGIFRDVTERKVFEEKLQELSTTDELTGLLNRRGFFTLAAKQLTISARTGSTLYLLYADLDNMKRINDQHGHSIGDQALMESASLLRETFRNGDIIARVGGDEFIILLTTIGDDQNEDSVLARFDRNFRRLNQQPDRDYEIHISRGIVKHEGTSPCALDDLLLEADQRMYENKRQRKNLS